MAISSMGTAMIAVGAICLVANTLFVGLRLYTRMFIMKPLRFNDALLFVALVRKYILFFSFCLI